MPLSPEARAVEAVLIVAVEPVPPGLLAELLEVPMLASRGSADAEALGVSPLPLAAVLGAAQRS